MQFAIIKTTPGHGTVIDMTTGAVRYSGTLDRCKVAVSYLSSIRARRYLVTTRLSNTFEIEAHSERGGRIGRHWDTGFKWAMAFKRNGLKDLAFKE